MAKKTKLSPALKMTSEDKKLCKAVDALLASLPDTPAKIAKVLEKAAVVGVRQIDSDCPIAQYIVKMVPGVQRAQAHFVAITVEGNNSNFQSATPPAVAKFLKNFDAGKYPKLSSE